MGLTMQKIHRLMQAACKKFNVATNRYVGKVLADLEG